MKIKEKSNNQVMTKQEARNLLYLLWHKGYLQSNFTDGHSEFDEIVEIISKRRMTEDCIAELIYNM